MSVVKKIKTNDTSSRPYQTEWSDKYGVIEKNRTTLCLICNEKVTSRTYNVKRHFEKMHSSLSLSTDEERRIYFLQKKKENHSQTSVLETFLIPKNNITAASFQVAHCIARQGKPLSEGEIVKQAVLECSATLFADFKEKDLIIKRINELPISRNTIKDRVIELERNIFSQIHNDLNYAQMYSIALDESNDVNGYAQLAVFARYKS
ncbi:EPM2A-interacting protein 1-like [Centruroides vittatus]|uniref:EPM2A-interacting protein 1-like n=1 Tax=Centruroides vittatus TaxID=120091 RepID=UPI00350F3EF1